MPDSPAFDEARRALGAVPTPDLWADAERRAAGGGVVPLAPDDRERRPGRWLAAAAAVALVAGTVAVILDDDGDGQVDTTPETTDRAGPTVVEGDGCTYGVTGEPIVMQPGPPDPPIFAGAPSDEGTVSHAELGGQRVEVRVPGLAVIDLVGERVEQVELERGTADVWFGPDFVQVRWFTGFTSSEDPCESFTVTVTGSTEDGNRHAAVAFAERILLPSDLGGVAPDDPGDAYAIWPITYPGQPTGDLVHPMQTTAEAAVAFARDMLGWDDATSTDGEPSEDGREGGAVHIVESAEVGGAVSVWVAPGSGSDGLVVYRVDVPGRSQTQPQQAHVSISGLTARVDVSPVPGATSLSDAVKLFYGDELLGEGEMGEEIRLSAAPTVPGRVLVIFYDTDGLPISAWGIALPAGDFAAG